MYRQMTAVNPPKVLSKKGKKAAAGPARKSARVSVPTQVPTDKVEFVPDIGDSPLSKASVQSVFST